MTRAVCLNRRGLSCMLKLLSHIVFCTKIDDALPFPPFHNSLRKCYDDIYQSPLEIGVLSPFRPSAENDNRLRIKYEAVLNKTFWGNYRFHFRAQDLFRFQRSVCFFDDHWEEFMAPIFHEIFCRYG